MRFTYNSTSFYDTYVNCSIRVKNLGAEIEKKISQTQLTSDQIMQ